ncbi:MAG TPA: FtsH protease activity modulator HflK [Steroidobacteraceae bacterium]|nr:FtsH protease activity modulator HflK [Steroidobacteraceae bacterium]
MAWNDPGEKRNPWNRQKPPNDLDEILRNVQRRLAALFGRKAGAAGGGAGGAPSAVNVGRGVSIVLVTIGVIWIGSGVYRVDAQERAVILRFGKYEQTTGPGYNWHLPWPIERKIIVNVSRLYSVTDETSMLTADTNLVEVKSAVQYTQPDPLRLLFEVRDVDETLAQASESAMREAIGQATLDKALAFDPSITDRAHTLLQRTLDGYDMGIHIVSVNLTDVNVPEPVQEAQRDAIKADKDRQRYQQEAELFRNDILPRARGAAAKAVQDAEAYQAKVVALAQGDSARFDQVFAQYQRAPAVTRERMYLGTMEEVYKNARKVLVDTKGANNVMYLPLDKLIAAPAAAVTGAQAGAPKSDAAAAPAATQDAQAAAGDGSPRVPGAP